MIRAAERELAKRGGCTAHLVAAVGNHRAFAFYEKCGWRRTGGEFGYQAGTGVPGRTVEVRCVRFERDLRGSTDAGCQGGGDGAT